MKLFIWNFRNHQDRLTYIVVAASTITEARYGANMVSQTKNLPDEDFANCITAIWEAIPLEISPIPVIFIEGE